MQTGKPSLRLARRPRQILIHQVQQILSSELTPDEFDAARLRAACERHRQNAPLFLHVVHISPPAVEAVYREGGADKASALRPAPYTNLQRRRWAQLR